MTTPIPTNLRRIPEVSMLVATVADAMKDPAAVKARGPREVNSTLCILEIITGLPPQWFTPEERTLVCEALKEFHGDPVQFINDIVSGTLSYAPVCADLVKGRTTQEMVDMTILCHLHAFGGID